jgi:hypothetical protein
VVAQAPFHFQYPPYFFVLALPLASVPMLTAWMIWNAIGLVLLLFTIYELTVHLPSKDWQSRLALTVAVLSAFPVWLAFQLGQPVLIELPAVAFFFFLLREKKFFAAGVACAFVAIKVQYVLPLVLVGLIAGSWRYLLSFAVTMGAVLYATAQLLGTDNVIFYPQALKHAETSQTLSGVNVEVMQNLRGELTSLLSGHEPVVVLVAMLGLVFGLLIIGTTWWHFLRNFELKDSRQYRILASATVLIMLTTSLHTHIQDYLLAAIPCLWLFEASSERSTQQMRYLYYLVASFPALSWVFYIFLKVFQFFLIQPFFVVAAAMSILSLKIYFQVAKTKAEAPELEAAPQA